MAAVDPEGQDRERSSTARFVRPYTITAGRTRSTVELPIEATLSRQSRTSSGLSAAALKVLNVCDTKSVAEVSALVSMPIGVVRVLLGDLVQQGYVQVLATITERSTKDECIELIERTLRGLRTY